MRQSENQKILPKKSLGQNWLINPGVIDKIVGAAEINSNDIVIEIGPGTGILTEKLAKKAGTVIAVEKDRRLIPQISQLATKYGNVKIIEQDALKFNPSEYELQDTKYKVVANIPYYITSNLLRKIFEEWPKPELIVLTIQKEVAQRILAKPPHMNLLALSVQYYSIPQIISYVSKNSFRPVPKVDSAIIKLITKHVTYNKQADKLFELIRAGFSEKRKQLAPVLCKKLKIPKEKVINALEKEGIVPNVRAENLSLENWIALQKTLIT